MSESVESITHELFLVRQRQAHNKNRARKLILFGRVLVNGWIEQRSKRGLFDGDVVTVADQLSEDDPVVGDREFEVDLSEDGTGSSDEE